MTLNSMRVWFGHYAKYVMGFMFIAMVVTTFSWNGLGRGNNAQATNQQNPDEVVATVDGQQVTRQEFNDDMDRIQRQMGAGGVSLTMRPFMESYAMQQLLQTYEMMAKAQAMGIKVTDDDIKKERETLLTEQNGRKQLGLPSTASLADVDAALQAQGRSIDSVFPEGLVKQAIVMQKLQDQIKKSTVVTEQVARDSYIQYKTQHILIDNQKRSDVQAQALAKEVIAKAKAPGADFAALAKKYSEDFGTKDKGGEDGWIDAGTHYVDEFKTAAFALKPGQVTADPVKSPSYGYFVIKLEAIRNNLPKDFDKDKAKYISQVAQAKQSDAMNKFQSELQAAPHNIVMHDPKLKADKEFQDAQRLSPPDPVKQDGMYKQAIADYNNAIKKSTSAQDKAVMYVQIANADQALKDVPGQIAALEAALKANGTDEPNLLNTLGGLYKGQKQNDKAIDAYQRASKAAWTDKNIHQGLAASFDSLGRKDLGDAERKWVVDYDIAHPQPKTPSFGGPGGQQLSLTPAGGGKVTAKPTTVQAVDSSTPPPASTTPAKPATAPVKPAQ